MYVCIDRWLRRFVATYETALMRDYYNGRTETLRSCNVEATEWVRTFLNPDDTVRAIWL